MRTLREAAGRELLWTPRSRFSRTWVLVDPELPSGEPFATLHWRLGFMPPAEGEAADSRWFFRRRGFWRETVIVGPDPASPPSAQFRRYFRQGVLRFEDGREFRWRHESFWRGVWIFEDPDGLPVLRFKRRLAFLKAVSGLEVEASARDRPEVPLLAVLGWYLILLAHRRAMAHAGGG